MEGWLYLIRSNRLGLQFSRKRYFVLNDHCLKCFKSVPSSTDEKPVRSVTIDSCIRVRDNGRESIQRKVFFIFTLYNTSNHNDQLKGGPDPGASVSDCSTMSWQSLRLSGSNTVSHVIPVDWTLGTSDHTDLVASDVVAPSPWTIFDCQNGLWLFKEAKQRDSHGKWDDHPAVMAVGVVDGTSEAIFQTLMSLGPSRSEGMKCRDLLLRRYWRREDDGTYGMHSIGYYLPVTSFTESSKI